MKQNISTDDLIELTDEQKEKIREMWEPKYGESVFYEKEGEGVYTGLGKGDTLPLLSIGQMIEILVDHYLKVGSDLKGYPLINAVEHGLCDKLWLAVKNIL